MPHTPAVEIITIGDELLYGQVIDTNSAWMGQELGQIGLRIRQISSVSDQATEIVRALDEARARAQVVLLTGGLGPTKDDLTKHVLAKYFHSELALYEPSLRDVEAIFARFNRPMLEVNRQQAFLPTACTPLRNTVGTAPGMWFDGEDGVVFVSMPGVPFEMKHLMTTHVLPKLRERFQVPPIEHAVLQTVGQGESFLAEQIAGWEAQLPPNMKLAYLPSFGAVRLRLTATDDGQPGLRQRLEAQLPAVRALIGPYLYAEGEVTLEAALGERLKERGLTIGTAESCTGGTIAQRLTSVPGSSAYFLGSVVAYSNQVKISQLGVSPDTLEQYGAVSEQTVREMAEGLRRQLGVDVAVATSGVAGPGGGTDEKPVGTFWLAYADQHQTVAQKVSINRGRELNISYISTVALNLVRRNLPLQP